MQERRRKVYRIGLKVLLGALFLCGASGAAAVYVGPAGVMGPSFADINGAECKTVATVKATDGHGLLVKQFVVASADDDVVRLRTALRVATALRQEQSPHLVQVSIIDANGPTLLAAMRGRAVGAKVTLLANPANDVETRAGPASGFSVIGPAGPDGSFYGIRLDAMPEEIKRMSAAFEEISTCGEPDVASPTMPGV